MDLFIFQPHSVLQLNNSSCINLLQYIQLFIHSLISSFIYSFIHLLINSFTHFFIRLLTYSYNQSVLYLRSAFYLFINSPLNASIYENNHVIYLRIHLVIYLSWYSINYSSALSFISSFTYLFIY